MTANKNIYSTDFPAKLASPMALPKKMFSVAILAKLTSPMTLRHWNVRFYKNFMQKTAIITIVVFALSKATFADNGKTEISQSMLPLSITTPGSYILTESITGTPGANGITILTNNVTINLNGFSLIGTTGTLNGIQSISNSINIKIVNGTVRNWGHDGIDMGYSQNCIFKFITATDNERDGLNAGFGATVISSIFINNGPRPHNALIDYGNGVEVEQNSTVTLCISTGNNQHGIIAHSGSVIADCTMLNNGHDGIHGSHNITITRCTAAGNDENIEMDTASILSDSSASHSSGDGLRVKRTGLGSGIIRNCTTYTSAQDGVDVDAGSIVIGCNSYKNTKHGIRVEPNSMVINNISTYNASSGIKLGGPDCRAENNIILNNADGIITENSNDSIILKNIADNYIIEAGNHFEQISLIPPALPDNPWINILW